MRGTFKSLVVRVILPAEMACYFMGAHLGFLEGSSILAYVLVMLPTTLLGGAAVMTALHNGAKDLGRNVNSLALDSFFIGAAGVTIAFLGIGSGETMVEFLELAGREEKPVPGLSAVTVMFAMYLISIIYVVAFDLVAYLKDDTITKKTR